MKKLQSLLLLGFLMILAACSNDELIAPDAPTGQSITVTIPGSDSRAIADYGKGTNVNRCILDIYHNGEVYGTRHIATVTDGKATFTDLRLVASQTYDFVFWADCADGETDKYFDTSDLQKISFKDYTGNQDAFDAFFKTETFTVTEAFTKTVELRRPFGQLNIKTLDVDQIFKDELKPAKVKVEFTAVPTEFNARSGEVSNEQAVSYEADMEDAATGEISVDYIFAAVDEASLADFAITLYNAAGTEITKNADFTSIPIRRNYRTNITGNLLTKQGAFNVVVVPDFYTPDIDKEITEVSTVEEANAALAAGKTDIIVAEVKADDELIIPKTDTAVEKISVTLPETNETVTVSYGVGTAAPTEVVITMPKSENLTINLPESTVTLNGAAYNNVTATVSDNTLIIPAGTTVANLTVNKGNVEIYGVVKVWNVRSLAELQAAAKAGTKCEHIVVAADIDLSKAGVLYINNDMYLTLAEGVTVTTARQANLANIVVREGAAFTVDGEGTVSGDNRLIDVLGKAIVKGGHYRSSTKNKGSILTVEEGGEVIIDDCDMLTAYCAIWNEGTVTINGGKIKSTNSALDTDGVKDGFSYCVRTPTTTGVLTINGGDIEGVQGAVGMYGGKVTINGGYIHTHPRVSKNDNYYALYCSDGAGGMATINGGKFYSEGNHDVYCTDVATIEIKGGIFEDKGYSEVTKTVMGLSEGYVWKDITDGVFKYEVVAE